MARILSLLLGTLLGLLALELALRLTIYEHEADRNYWGKGAFVADDACVYRQAPEATATTGRRGMFGPSAITTNADGYRGPRLTSDDSKAPRLMVVGASTMFGLGISDDEAVFCRQLERQLRSRPDLPDSLQVFNVSQTGYLSLELLHLVRREVGRVRPTMVLLVLTPNTHTTHFADREIDIVNGYRLPSRRFMPATWLDSLRTSSYAFMQISGSPLTRASAYTRNQLLTRLFFRTTSSGGPKKARAAGARGDRADVAAHVREAHLLLQDLGIEMACAVAYAPHQRGRWLRPLLEDTDIEVHEIDIQPSWLIQGDGHWTEEGHRKAAQLVGRLIPAEPFR
ncbi:MAG: hypothetical protein ACI8QZ_002968 [Chlamydiales bacterium]|jgi:hypothetical protein